MERLSSKEIKEYNINTENKEKPVLALFGYDYWHCPRCKCIIDANEKGFFSKCDRCGQTVKYDEK